MIVASRLLGPQRFGVFGTLYSGSILTATLLHLSLGQAALAHAGKPFHSIWVAKSIRTAKALSLLAIPIASVVGVVLQTLGIASLPSSWLLLAVLVPLMMWDYYAIQFLSSAGEIVRLSWTLVAGKSTSAVALLFGSMLGPVACLLGVALGLLVELILALHFLAPHSYSWTNASEDLAPVRTGLVLHMAAIGSILLSQGPVVLLALLQGPYEAGQYLLAFQMLAALLVLPTGVSMVLAGRISQEGPARAWNRQVAWAGAVALLMACLAAGVWSLRPILATLLGPENSLAVSLFVRLLPALLGWTVMMLLGSQWVARGLVWQSAAVTLGLALLNLALSWSFVGSRGTGGAALAISLTFGIALLVNLSFVGWVYVRGVSTNA